MAAGGNVDGGGDTMGPPPDGSVCVGKGLLGSLCLTRTPTSSVTLAGSTINTASTAAGNCTELHPQTGGPSLCIVAGTVINIASGITVRGIGPNPLVLFATRSISIAGSLDVSTHSNETIGGAPAMGAGARSATDCAAIGTDGQPGKLLNNNDLGGGGAGGGSFGTVGGAGGTGGNGNIGQGNPVAGGAAGAVVGGCPGGHGGEGEGGGVGGGIGGNGGGAVYLLAGESILVSGTINASGSGGGAGTDGIFSSGGGGGGGAGGLIGLEASRVLNDGTLFANGGGGGGGGGSQATNHGVAGGDPTGALTAAIGGTGGNGGGGDGGTGSTGAVTGVAGKNSQNSSKCAGGGGGGGAGVIRVFGASAAAIGGTVSPPAT
jgi:hypothetical protein